MRFLMIPGALSHEALDGSSEAFDPELFQAYMRYNEEMHRAGILIASEGLQPSAGGAHVRIESGKKTVIDGPFAESKELIAGFWLIEVPSKQEAIEWALRCPVGPADEVIEIRPLTGAADLPNELNDLIAKAAPSWSKTFQHQQ